MTTYPTIFSSYHQHSNSTLSAVVAFGAALPSPLIGLWSANGWSRDRGLQQGHPGSSAAAPRLIVGGALLLFPRKGRLRHRRPAPLPHARSGSS
jgi:ABC-type spermidine/putrescine transport system permease subunit II